MRANKTIRSGVIGAIASSVYWAPDLIAQAATGLGVDWGALLQNAGFAALVFYLIAIRLPQIENRHQEQIDKTDQRHRAEREKWRETLQELQNKK